MIPMAFESPYRVLSAHLRRHLAENHVSCREVALGTVTS
jgi:hypothetical protein